MDSDASISPRRRSCYSDSGDSSCSEPFSECGSDDLSFNPAVAAGIDRLLLSCVAEASDDSISSLVAELESPSASVDSLRRAAMELRLLAKHNPDNRIRIAASGAVRPLVALLSHADPLLQEHGITALLNLSICDENAACALLRLSQLDGHAVVGRAGAIPLLMSLLETGGPRGKKDAATTLYALCSGARENRLRSGLAGARPARTTPLVEAPGMGGGVDVEAMAVVGGHVQVRVARMRWLGRLVRAVAALENLRLAVLHLAVTSVGNDAVVYCFKALLDEREETSVAAMVRFVLVGIPGA